MFGKTYVFLDTRQLHNSLVDGALRDQTIDGNLTGLTQTMSTIHCLSVIGGVPIVIIEDHGIGGSKIDSKSTRSCTEQENEDILPERVRKRGIARLTCLMFTEFASL